MASPAFDRRLARVVQIKLAGADGKHLIGTGYLVAPGLVLTARHVLHRDGKIQNERYELARLRVRAATGPAAGSAIGVRESVTLGDAHGLDAAVLVVPELEAVPGTVVVGAVADGEDPLEGCRMIGYPRISVEHGVARPEYVQVTVLTVLDGAADGFAVRVNTPPPKDDLDWGGLSGSGVVDAQGRLLGVLTAAQPRWRERLKVAPIGAVVAAARRQVDEAPALAPLAGLALVSLGGGNGPHGGGGFPPRLTDLRSESLFDALHFKYRVVPFIADEARERLLAEALAWAADVEDGPDLRVAVVTGPAGAGKSRMAMEICDRLTATQPWWSAGFADYAHLPDAGELAVPTLLVCDYPERRPEAIGEFLNKVLQRQRARDLQAPVRVLLVSRHEKSWYQRMHAKARNLHNLIDRRMNIGSDQFGADERRSHAAAAFAAFCDGFRISENERPVFEVDDAELDRPLLVHIAALLAARRAATRPEAERIDVRGRDSEAAVLLDDLIDAEATRLLYLPGGNRASEAGHVFGSVREVLESMCVTTLTAPVRSDLPELLACTESFGPHGGGNRVVIADALLHYFPQDREFRESESMSASVAPVEPDLIAAHVLARTPGRSGIVQRLVASPVVAERPEYHAQLVGMLALAADDYPDVAADLKAHLATSLSALVGAKASTSESLAKLLSERLVALVEAAVNLAAEQDFTAARELTAAVGLAELTEHHEMDEAALPALGKLPGRHPVFTGLGVTLARRAAVHFEQHGVQDNAATAQAMLGAYLGNQGLHRDALAATERALLLSNDLAEEDHIGHPEFALLVGELAVRLWRVGRWTEALNVSEDAVALYQQLIDAGSDRFRIALAGAFGNRACVLESLERLPEALSAVGRSIELWEELVEQAESAEQDATVYLVELVGMIHNRARWLLKSRHFTDAVEAATHAVDICNTLTEHDLIAHRLLLARAKSVLARALSSLGRHEEARETIANAEELYEASAESNSEARLHDLAAIKSDHFRTLLAADRVEEALLEFERSLRIYDDMAASDEALYLPTKANMLTEAADLLAEAGSYGESVAMTKRAVASFKKLVAVNRAKRLPALAAAVHNLGCRLGLVGRWGDAVKQLEKAVKMRRELADTHSPEHLPPLAASMQMLANAYDETGRYSKAFHGIEQAVKLYDSAVESDRAAHLPSLGGAHTLAGIMYGKNGSALTAVRHFNQAIAYFRELAETDPALHSWVEQLEGLRAGLIELNTPPGIRGLE